MPKIDLDAAWEDLEMWREDTSADVAAKDAPKYVAPETDEQIPTDELGQELVDDDALWGNEGTQTDAKAMPEEPVIPVHKQTPQPF